MFVLCVYAALDLIPAYDPGEYPAQWHLHRDVERYMIEVLKFAGEIPVEDAKPGDVILFKFGRTFSHGAIVVEGQQIIHAVMKDGMVVLGDLDRDVDTLHREKKCFSYWMAQDGG